MMSKAMCIGSCGLFLGCALGADVTLEAFELQVMPSPAQEGDLVWFRFHLTVIAQGTVTLTALIDGEEYREQTVSSPFSEVVDWEIADAAELIEHFGLGDHTARVSVLDSESGHSANTEVVTFALVEPTPETHSDK